MNRKICEALFERFGQPLYEEIMNEVAPPGEEKLVLALKKNKEIDNPWAVAWSIHNKKKNKKNKS